MGSGWRRRLTDVPDVPPDPFAAEGAEPIEAATVVPLRDGADGLETLLLRRAAGLSFAGGMWVWPGGRIDPEDRADATDLEHAARRAAVREAAEEASLAVAEGDLVWFSHWTPPAVNLKRFRTFFFAAVVEGLEAIVVDGGEMLEHRWVTPSEALELHTVGEIALSPPTFITLATLVEFSGAEQAHAALGARGPEFFATRFVEVPGGAVAVYHGDAACETDPPDPDRPGGRHRLWMVEGGWRYERSS